MSGSHLLRFQTFRMDFLTRLHYGVMSDPFSLVLSPIDPALLSTTTVYFLLPLLICRFHVINP